MVMPTYRSSSVSGSLRAYTENLPEFLRKSLVAVVMA
jgi:hypothetical protein